MVRLKGNGTYANNQPLGKFQFLMVRLKGMID